MTEEEWLKCIDDTYTMSTVVIRHRFSRIRRVLISAGFSWASRGIERKMCLFSCSFCRKYFDELGSDDRRRSVEIAEACSDNTSRSRAEERAVRESGSLADHLFQWDTESYIKATMYQSPEVVAERKSKLDSMKHFGCDLFRELFGNPFRPVRFNTSWLTSTVVSIAKSMYDSRDFSPMPLLADALQDAGCGQLDILEHCRSESAHVRGCWVVDLILGKE